MSEASAQASEIVEPAPAAAEAAAPAAAPQATPEATAQAAPAAGVDVRPADLPEATDSGASGNGQIDMLLEATVPVTARLGEVEVPLKRLLQLAPGSVVTLDKQAGEPVDLLLRGVRFATGHLVVVGDRLGVRIKEIVAQANG